MSVELGSVWIDNDSDLLVIVKSLEAKFDGKVTVIFNYIVRTGDKSIESASELELFLNTKTKLVRYAEKGNVNNKDDQNLNYRMGYNDGWHDCEASFELGNEFTDNIQEQAYDEGYVEGYNQHEYEMHQVMSEREFESIIDEAFEEGYAQAYSEIQSKTERERVLQEKAWDEGYSQAISDVIDEDFEDDYSEEDCSEESYSEYEFGDVEDGEEEYCFSKELDKILNGAFVVDTKTEGSERKHSHYFKDVRHLDYIDVYELNKLFPIDDDTDCILHARKKLLVCGGRGGSKDMITDITDARDTLNRYLQIEGIE